MKGDETFKHTPITEPGVIRLIKLQPSQDLEAGLKCSLIHKSLEDCQYDIVDHFMALSYVWGDQTERGTISIDGKPLDITASLQRALRHIRDRDRMLYIWADGVCVNQADLEDRNTQVTQMGAIYSTAHHTISFLGTAEISQLALQGIVRQVLQPVKLDNDESVAAANRIQEGILKLPYFTRVWILQELALSSDVWVQSGTTRLRWNAFYEHLTSVYSGPALKRLRAIHSIKQKHVSTDEPRGPAGPPSAQAFLDIVDEGRGSAVTDLRDLVYGHVGLSKAPMRTAILVDYSKTAAEVFEDIAVQYVTLEGTFGILGFVEPHEQNATRHNLPSWVPDWTVPYDGSCYYTSEDYPRHYIFANTQQLALVGPGQHHGTISLIIDLTWPSGAQYNGWGIDAWAIKQETPEAFETLVAPFIPFCNNVISSNTRRGGQDEPTIAERRQSSDRVLDRKFVVLVSLIFEASHQTPIDPDSELGLDLSYVLYNLLIATGQLVHDEPIAILDTCRVFNVSTAARVGDIICVLSGLPGWGCVMRQKSMSVSEETKLRQDITKRYKDLESDPRAFGAHYRDVEKDRINAVTFIGMRIGSSIAGLVDRVFGSKTREEIFAIF